LTRKEGEIIMTEALIIKCPECKQWFDRSKYTDEPIVENCECGNITIKVETLGDEKPLFKVIYTESEPIYKIPKIK
tara:strand:+ start:330 stop:557 length:228 start_codon:yes stop_codon:yes gene_type:complete